MTRKGIIIVLLFASWPINSIHRLWNNRPADIGHWYLFEKSYSEDIQWYVHDICQCVYILFILTAIWLHITSHKKRDSDVNYIFGAILINHIIDIFHYIGWHRRSELMLAVEGCVLLYAAIKIFLKNRKT